AVAGRGSSKSWVGAFLDYNAHPVRQVQHFGRHAASTAIPTRIMFMKRTLREVLSLSLVLTAGTVAAQAPADSESRRPGLVRVGPPAALEMKRARSTGIDLRTLSNEPEKDPVAPVSLAGGLPQIAAATATGPSTAAPATLSNFPGLDFANWGSRRPPDPVG